MITLAAQVRASGQMIAQSTLQHKVNDIRCKAVPLIGEEKEIRMHSSILSAKRLLLTLVAGAACGTQQIPPNATRSSVPVSPEIFAPGVISDDQEQWRITFTPDGRTAYFASSPEFFPISRRATIYVSHFKEGRWDGPVVAPFSGTHGDIDPFVSPDGKRLYFSSTRPVNGVSKRDLDIWFVDRVQSEWSEPVHLDSAVNSARDELYPSASADGTLFFASGPFAPQAGQHWDIYMAERTRSGFAPRKALGPGVNSQPGTSDTGPQDAWEFNPEISMDGKTLVFTSLRRGGNGLGDLYVSHLVNGEWSAARNVGPLVNTAADEYHPTLSRDGRDLYFVRRGPRKGDFFRIPTSALDLFSRMRIQD
jgi:Tol biopolymer transport system component